MPLMALVTAAVSPSLGQRTHPASATPSAAHQVQGLEALGFPRDACVEALMACGWNEELAANILAEQMFDD